MEKHTANIYTRTMFEKFQEVLYKSGSYYVDELVPGEIYVAKHFNGESLEKWCKVEYKVSVKDGYYAYECGMYEHMGMLCCHVVKVLTLIAVFVQFFLNPPNWGLQKLVMQLFADIFLHPFSAGTSPPQVHRDPCPTCDEEMDSGRAGCFAAPHGAVPEGPGADDIFQLQAFAAIPQLHGGGEARGCKH
jgi:hypothetical protein